MINTPPADVSHGSLNNISQIRYYEILLTSGSIASPTITLSFNNDVDDEDVTDPLDLRIARSTDGSNWTDAGGSGSFTVAPAGTATSAATTITAGTFFTLASATSDNTLPVELSFFEARSSEGKVLLEWTTESEIDNAYWLIQRKEVTAGEAEAIEAGLLVIEDVAGTFNTVNNVRGQGTKASATEYSLMDGSVETGKTYAYRLADVSFDGHIAFHDVKYVTVELPTKFALKQNFPNPFNPTTTIRFTLPVQATVTLKVYNILGQEIASLVDQTKEAGFYEVNWNGRNRYNQAVPSGIYIYRMIASGGNQKEHFVQTRKMVMVK
jgi:hypothetical protein